MITFIITITIIGVISAILAYELREAGLVLLIICLGFISSVEYITVCKLAVDNNITMKQKRYESNINSILTDKYIESLNKQKD